MNEIVKVGNHDVVEIQWRGQKVITTAQLAEVYDCLLYTSPSPRDTR